MHHINAKQKHQFNSSLSPSDSKTVVIHLVPIRVNLPIFNPEDQIHVDKLNQFFK